MNKEDYIFIAQRQRLAFTTPKLWSMSIKALSGTINMPIESDILIDLEKLKMDREKYSHYTIEQVKKLLFERLITFPSGANKGGLIDILNSSENVEIFNLDDDQQSVINHIAESKDKMFIIQAGAGAGKTTTLTHIAKRLIDLDSSERILVLAYNVAAEAAFIKKTKMIKVPRISNPNIYDNSKFGTAICTFDKFGNRVNQFDDKTHSLMYEGEEEIDYNFTDGYRHALERACINLMKSAKILHFTTMIIDEAQDILPQHVQIINVMMPHVKRVIIAGDPMQELYEGASWYRTLLKEHKILNLRYNHRSHPEIVKALNIFAERNFPDIYVPQIATLPETNDGKRRFKILTLDSDNFTYVGNVCGEIVSTDSRYYILSPITTCKFGLTQVAPSARQMINEIRPSTVVQVAKSGEKIDDAQCVISTSKLVKGTEADNVIIYGTELSYSIIVSKDVIARHIYVALSRAINNVTLVHRTTMDVDAHILLQDLLKFADCGPIVIRPSNSFINTSINIDVTSGGDFTPESGLCASESIKLGMSKSLPTGQLLPIEIMDDLDFVNIYVESIIMDRLGILPFQPADLDIIIHTKKYSRLVYEDKIYKIVTSSENEPLMRSIVDKVKEMGPANNAYAYALVKFSIMAGRLWTISERLEYSDYLDPYINNCVKQLMVICGDDAKVKFMTCGTYNVKPGRQEEGDSTAVINYDINIVINGRPVEIKFFDEITPLQRKRAAIYAALLGAPSAIIYNLKTGIIENIASSSIDQIEMTAKAIVGLRFAKDFKAKMVKYSSTQKPVKSPAANAPCVISVDMETIGDLTTEIAAIAFSPTDYKILGVYHKILPGVSLYRGKKNSNIQREICAKLTNLDIVDEVKLRECQISQTELFKQWIFELSETAPILHWSGSEGKEYKNTIDVRNSIYRPWLIHEKMSSTKLTDASEHICRKFNWMAHRAFDDTIINSIIFMACSEA
jgi:hypothetical protein